MKRIMAIMAAAGTLLQGSALAAVSEAEAVGEIVELAIGCPTALINGIPKRIDNDDLSVVPFLSDTGNTMVPLRFVSEAFGAEVEWDPKLQRILITLPNEDQIEFTVGSVDYEYRKYDGMTAAPHAVLAKSFTVDYGKSETAPVIVSGRTMVPLRIIGETMGRNVYWDDGLITICDIERNVTDAEKRLSDLLSAPIPERVVPTVINEGEESFTNQPDV